MNARCYDPQIKRFINADHINNLGANGDLNAFNLYAYCSNNPVMFVDPMGEGIIGAIALFTMLGVGLFAFTSDTAQEPTDDAIKQAINAADQADLKPSKDSEGNYTIEIIIDTQYAIDNVDIIAYSYYYERLYERTVEFAKSQGFGTGHLMDVDHIRWEFRWHALAHFLGFSSAKTTNLNVDETRWSMIERGWEAIWYD